MVNNAQLKLIHQAARAAGLIDKTGDQRYRLVLRQYRDRDGRPAASSKQLSNQQIDDLLALCESMGFRLPNRPSHFFRDKAAAGYRHATIPTLAALRQLAGDLGWTDAHLANFLRRMARPGESTDLITLPPRLAYVAIEAMKAMFNRTSGMNQPVQPTLADVQRYHNNNHQPSIDTEVSDVETDELEPAPF
jgi:hypothetical protein